MESGVDGGITQLALRRVAQEHKKGNENVIILLPLMVENIVLDQTMNQSYATPTIAPVSVLI